MTCHNCGGKMENPITDLPFKVGVKSIVIIKILPVVQPGIATNSSFPTRLWKKLTTS